MSIGRVESDYRFQEPSLHRRRVVWLATRLPRAGFSDVARQELSARVAFFAVRDSADEFASVVS